MSRYPELLERWFAHPWVLWALLVFPLVGLLGWWTRRRRRQTAVALGGVLLLLSVDRQRGWRVVRRGLLGMGLFLLILGTAGPQWGRDWAQSAAPGRDLMVVLDVSRSMFAETPQSRIDRARTALLRLADTLQEQGGHRIGLIAFAGRPLLVCRLTQDYDHFRSVVGQFQTQNLDRRLRPVEGSGTRIGAALSLAVQMRDPKYPQAYSILLLSDGDDPADRPGNEDEKPEQEWRGGALAARASDIPVHVVGIGDPRKAVPIPLPEGGFEEGTATALREEPLREIARLTRGTYTAMHSGSQGVAELFLREIAPGKQRDENPDTLPVYTQRYALFLGPALLLLTLGILVPEGRPRKEDRR